MVVDYVCDGLLVYHIKYDFYGNINNNVYKNVR